MHSSEEAELGRGAFWAKESVSKGLEVGKQVDSWGTGNAPIGLVHRVWGYLGVAPLPSQGLFSPPLSPSCLSQHQLCYCYCCSDLSLPSFWKLLEVKDPVQFKAGLAQSQRQLMNQNE